jgi:C-8 sterol isomerase
MQAFVCMLILLFTIPTSILAKEPENNQQVNNTTQKSRFTVFDPQLLEQIVRDSVARFATPQERLQYIEQELANRYPKYVSTNRPYHFIGAGGTFGAVKILHASITEYIIVYGTKFANSGPSGRFPFVVRDYVVSGRLATHLPENVHEVNYFWPGQVTTLKPFKNNFYQMEPDTWLIEYGSGFIPGSLVSILANLVTTFDFVGTAKLSWDFGTAVLGQLFKGKI